MTQIENQPAIDIQDYDERVPDVPIGDPDIYAYEANMDRPAIDFPPDDVPADVLENEANMGRPAIDLIPPPDWNWNVMIDIPEEQTTSTALIILGVVTGTLFVILIVISSVFYVRKRNKGTASEKLSLINNQIS